MVARVESHDTCFVYGGVDHQAQDCHTYCEMGGVHKEQCYAIGEYKKHYTSYSKTYNLG